MGDFALDQRDVLQLYGAPSATPTTQRAAAAAVPAQRFTAADPPAQEPLLGQGGGGGGGSASRVARWAGITFLVLVAIALGGAAVGLLVDIKDDLRVHHTKGSGIVYETIYDDNGGEFRIVTADIFCIGSGPAGASTCKAATDDGVTSAVILEAGPLRDKDKNITLGVYNRVLLSLYADKYGWPGKSEMVRPFAPAGSAKTQEMQSGFGVGGASAWNNMNAVWPSEPQMDAFYEASGNSPLFTVAKQKAALKALETYNPISSADPLRGTEGPYQVTQVPLAGPLTFATKLMAAFNNVTGYGELTDYMVTSTVVYGFTRTWNLFMDLAGFRSDSRTAFLNAGIVTETDKGHLVGVDGRQLELLTDAYVTKINFDTSESTPLASGVTFIYKGVPYIGVARKAVVDASGFFSPHLLQVSGIGDEAVLADAGIGLVKHLPNVGRKFKNHLAISWTFSKTSADVATDPSNGNYTCTAGAFYPSPIYPSDPRRGIQYLFQDGLVNGGNNIDPVNQPPTPNPAALVITGFLLHPDSEGTIFPRTSSIFAEAQYNYNYGNPATKDLEFFVNASRRDIAPVSNYLNSATSGAYVATNPTTATIADDTLIANFVRDNVRQTHHGSGACGMGVCADGAVVDGLTGRVCGVRGLFAWNTQVLPIQSDGNHQFPTAMISKIFTDNAIENDWYVSAPAA